ncbi:hypothetical protein TUBRATIS_13510 [Tubulinosema ratisbonensis]|uniref:Uncharacterized protein n=1 Tax=Tubulinosema ratisbonensis TaxID=291195 RepID=A0A437ALR8_9MICR|nr:hypothetical protein TUBRATIS_13510 [Tubulinosema ratisbonensis]
MLLFFLCLGWEIHTKIFSLYFLYKDIYTQSTETYGKICFPYLGIAQDTASLSPTKTHPVHSIDRLSLPYLAGFGYRIVIRSFL